MKRTSKSSGRARIADGVPARMTMADLARIAGVSKITISRALGDGGLVNAETRARIRALAEKHGYALNVNARNLRLRRSHTIVVIVEMTPTSARPMSGPYPLALLGGLSQELTSAGYGVLLTTRQAAMTPSTRAADGVILLGQGAHEDAVHIVDRWRLPMVVWGAKRARDGHVVVGSDNRAGGALAAARFLAMRRRRPAFLGDLDHVEIAERHAGFRDRLRAHKLDVQAIRADAFTVAAGAAAVRALARRGGLHFDALFAGDDLLAMGAIHALIEHGRRVPEDVSVVGYDDSALAASFVPALTSVHQDWQSGGTLLARKILALIDGRRPRSEALPTSLIVRAT